MIERCQGTNKAIQVVSELYKIIPEKRVVEKYSNIPLVRMNGSKESLYRTLIQYRIGDVYIPHIPNTEALRVEMSHFVDCITTGKKSNSNGEAGLYVVKILEAAQQSLKLDGVNVTL